ncbi:MAG: CBS domain-containing protein [Magnetospirillum sp. WYHS-4]
MTCRSLMTSKPLVLRETDPLDKGVHLLLANRLHALPVVDGEGRYLGLFDLPSVFQAMLPSIATFDENLVDLNFIGDDIDDLRVNLPNDTPVIGFLDTRIEPIGPDLSLKETLLRVFRCRCALPVVDAVTGKLEGMVSPWGALDAIERRKKARS